MGRTPGPASKGRKRQGLSAVTQQGSICHIRVYRTRPGAPPGPPSTGLASPAPLVSTALLLSLPSWEQGFMEEASCLLLLLLLQSWPFATLPPPRWCPVPQGFFINLG